MKRAHIAVELPTYINDCYMLVAYKLQTLPVNEARNPCEFDPPFPPPFLATTVNFMRIVFDDVTSLNGG